MASDNKGMNRFSSMKMPAGKKMAGKGKPVDEELNEMDMELFGMGEEAGNADSMMAAMDEEEEMVASPLSEMSDDDLLAEVKKRGLSMDQGKSVAEEDEELGEELA